MKLEITTYYVSNSTQFTFVNYFVISTFKTKTLGLSIYRSGRKSRENPLNTIVSSYMFIQNVYKRDIFSTNLTLKIFENPKLTHEETFQKELRYTLNKIETILRKQIKLEQNQLYELPEINKFFCNSDIILPISIMICLCNENFSFHYVKWKTISLKS